MDKFNGINRAQVVSTNHTCEILPNELTQKKPTKHKDLSKTKKQKAKSGAAKFALIRYGICVAVLVICFLANVFAAPLLTAASTFIKDELSRDSITELAEIVDEAIS